MTWVLLYFIVVYSRKIYYLLCVYIYLFSLGYKCTFVQFTKRMCIS